MNPNPKKVSALRTARHDEVVSALRRVLHETGTPTVQWPGEDGARVPDLYVAAGPQGHRTAFDVRITSFAQAGDGRTLNALLEHNERLKTSVYAADIRRGVIDAIIPVVVSAQGVVGRSAMTLLRWCVGEETGGGGVVTPRMVERKAQQLAVAAVRGTARMTRGWRQYYRQYQASAQRQSV